MIPVDFNKRDDIKYFYRRPENITKILVLSKVIVFNECNTNINKIFLVHVFMCVVTIIFIIF